MGAAAVGVLDLEGFSHLLASHSTPPAETWRPWVLRLAPGERDRFEAVCRGARLTVIDTIERQLEDLARLSFPGSTHDRERRRFVADAVAARGGWTAYGSWVCFPWEARVLHLLDPEPFFSVITNRNADKISGDEQRLLARKRIGVVGLSVGGEAAVSVAQEHLCGSIVLADFDTLDLSNLNRLNAGVDELGLPKTTIVARRIAKINPYLDVTVFEAGVTPENALRFLDGLDLLVEECDSLPMKYELRRLAKARGVNVVYAADERGFLSVEPYGLWPDLMPFHGRIPRAQPPREMFPSAQSFLRALTEWMGGWERISERSQRSLEQVGDTLCGYPQLASEARFAAGLIGHVARRLLLGESLAPFLGNLDPAELLTVSETKRAID